MAKEKTAPAQASVDDNEGNGGSYTVDPATNQRKLVERTQPAEPAKSKDSNETSEVKNDVPANA